MTVKKLMICYVLFLVIVSVVINFELFPTPRELLQRYAPDMERHIPERIMYDDKIAHFFLAGTLAFLVNLYMGLKRIKIGPFKILKGSLLLLGVVFIEECSQLAFSSRTFSLWDLSANYLGVLVFGQAAVAVVKYRAFIEPRLPRAVSAIIWSPPL